MGFSGPTFPVDLDGSPVRGTAGATRRLGPGCRHVERSRFEQRNLPAGIEVRHHDPGDVGERCGAAERDRLDGTCRRPAGPEPEAHDDVDLLRRCATALHDVQRFAQQRKLEPVHDVAGKRGRKPERVEARERQPGLERVASRGVGIPRLGLEVPMATLIVTLVVDTALSMSAHFLLWY